MTCEWKERYYSARVPERATAQLRHTSVLVSHILHHLDTVVYSILQTD